MRSLSLRTLKAGVVRPVDTTAFTCRVNGSHVITQVSIGSIVQDGIGFRGNSRAFMALWDTGATYTSAVPRVIRTARITSDGFGKARGVDGNDTTRPLYTANIIIPTDPDYAFGNEGPPNQFMLHTTRIMGLERDDQLKGIDVLIGMDIMSRCDIAITTDAQGQRWFSCRLPSSGTRIDFRKPEKSRQQRRSGDPRRSKPYG